MTGRKNELKKKNSSQQSTSSFLLLDKALNTTDTGDDTQRRFRYQHAYGIVLLIRAIAGREPYTAILCEYHNDFVAQRDNGAFDVYQIKTRRNGSWTLSDEDLKSSIKRFVELDKEASEEINAYYFISNAGYEKSKARSKLGYNPVEFLRAVERATSSDILPPPFDTSFNVLLQYCQCKPLDLMTVLKKLKLVNGPGLDSFEDEIAQSHLASLTECKNLTVTALAKLREDLIAQIYTASSLSSGDPARHWYALNEPDHLNPQVQAKRITIENVRAFICASASISIKEATVLDENLLETLNLYLADSFGKDQLATLDQAGDPDSDRITPLHQVFIDLELKPRKDQFQLPLRSAISLKEIEQQTKELWFKQHEILSAMDCFLKEGASRFVIIGGPGQGKSTLGQYLAQIHRALLLNREKELYRDVGKGVKLQKPFRPKTKRIPFRIILKYFAQWLIDNSRQKKSKNLTVEAYIAEQVCKGAARPRAVRDIAVQKILKAHPTLLIFDGLDEVTDQELCHKMLSCIKEFLARAEQLDADMQVIATSRPTSYKDQFSPDSFWHLELQPLSIGKVNEYAANWTNIKVPVEEEQQRIKKTLEERLKEEHTRDTNPPSVW